jgi:hypothetical protein
MGGDFCSKLRAPHRGTSLGPFVCGLKHVYAIELCVVVAAVLAVAVDAVLVTHHLKKMFLIWLPQRTGPPECTQSRAKVQPGKEKKQLIRCKAGRVYSSRSCTFDEYESLADSIAVGAPPPTHV